MEFSRAKQKEKERALRHFRSKSELFRQRAARIILSGIVTASATTVILVAVQPDQKIQQQEVVIIQEAVGSPRKDEAQKTVYQKSEEQEVDIIVTFADESNQYPFAGYEITLQEWNDTPEWDIPQEFKDTGGCMPEAVRVYLHTLCKEKHISYPLMLALIEAESGYQWDNSSPDGSCKGYCMISDKWHQERMQRLGVTDIYNPYQNIAVSVDYLIELFEKYGEVHEVLMCYNCGESRAKEMWQDGIESTSYSRKIVEREAELSSEIYEY